jgi:hypothetical protein
LAYAKRDPPADDASAELPAAPGQENPCSGASRWLEDLNHWLRSRLADSCRNVLAGPLHALGQQGGRPASGHGAPR